MEFLNFFYQVGGLVLVLIVVVGWFILKSGVLKWPFRSSGEEQARLSKYALELIDSARTEAANQRAWRTADQDFNARRIAELERIATELRSQVTLALTDASRWRHLAMNLAQGRAHLVNRLRKYGEDVQPINYSSFLEEGGDPDIVERLNKPED